MHSAAERLNASLPPCLTALCSRPCLPTQHAHAPHVQRPAHLANSTNDRSFRLVLDPATGDTMIDPATGQPVYGQCYSAALAKQCTSTASAAQCTYVVEGEQRCLFASVCAPTTLPSTSASACKEDGATCCVEAGAAAFAAAEVSLCTTNRTSEQGVRAAPGLNKFLIVLQHPFLARLCFGYSAPLQLLLGPGLPCRGHAPRPNAPPLPLPTAQQSVALVKCCSGPCPCPLP